MKKIMLSALSVLTVVSMVACSSKNQEEKQLPVTDKKIQGNWKLTHFAQGNKTMSAPQDQGSRYYIISDGLFLTYTEDDTGVHRDAMLEYKIEDDSIITIDEKVGAVTTKMPDYKVVKLSATKMRLKTIDADDGNVDLLLTKTSDDLASINAHLAAAAAESAYADASVKSEKTNRKQ